VRCRMWLEDRRDVAPAEQRCRRLLDLDADPLAVAEHLGPDPLIGPLVRAAPGLRVPGSVDGAELAVRAILGQQISVAAARTITGRLARMLGEPLAEEVGTLRVAFPRPEAVAASSLAGLGVPASRSSTLVEVARAICEGRLDLSPGTDGEAARAAMLGIRGVGPWTADYVALRGLGDADAFLPSDLVIRQVLAGSDGLPSPAAVERRSQRWRPWRAYAVVHLWASAPSVRLARGAA
jgi:AraC family transcriptional regulator, regulatory protein of adaptative response / DNA-3-methyladenine glycosylase II